MFAFEPALSVSDDVTTSADLIAIPGNGDVVRIANMSDPVFDMSAFVYPNIFVLFGDINGAFPAAVTVDNGIGINVRTPIYLRRPNSRCTHIYHIGTEVGRINITSGFFSA
jgi:hypothetical protein